MSILPASDLTKDDSRLRSRAARFAAHLAVHTADEFDEPNEEQPQSPTKRLKGTCLSLEKPYLRLTSAPKPSSVRPLKILKDALRMVKEKYIADTDYSYICNQLKSIRQDLTVQSIFNKFTVHVYETHGRIALESGDLSEYNQCSSRLQDLKRQGLKLSEDEFDCYRILYCLLQENKLELVEVMRELAIKAIESSASLPDMIDKESGSLCAPSTAVRFALDVVRAVRSNNVTRFFLLYKNAPNLSW